MEYSLNFVIPEGLRGESAIEGIAYLEYLSKQSQGEVDINSSNSFTNNTTIFFIYTNKILLKKEGLYEFIFSGKIFTSINSDYSLKLISENNGNVQEIIDLSLEQSINEIYFSKIKILNLSSDNNISIIFDPKNNKIINLENTTLLIKKFK